MGVDGWVAMTEDGATVDGVEMPMEDLLPHGVVMAVVDGEADGLEMDMEVAKCKVATEVSEAEVVPAAAAVPLTRNFPLKTKVVRSLKSPLR